MPARSQALGPAAGPGQQHLATRLLDPLAAHHARQLAHAEDLRAAGSADAGELKGARKLGAKHAATDLQAHLGDDWVLFHGLRTTGGGIGQLLIGPRGLVAMTSMYLDATVHCRGDKWHAEKLSLDDRDGRSPSVQLNQAADVLEKCLHAAGLRFSVQRVVLLNHPRSAQGEWHRPTVQVFGSAFDFITWLNKLPKTLDRGQKRQLENLITGDNHHHP